ncbi:hypothetical protein NSI01_17810 [Pimelobacter simplex]|nr:hypothetical protein NSI01_17810 [Pimelobacter simplex]
MTRPVPPGLAWAGEVVSTVRPEKATAAPREPNNNCFTERMGIFRVVEQRQELPKSHAREAGEIGGKRHDLMPTHRPVGKQLGKTPATNR